MNWRAAALLVVSWTAMLGGCRSEAGQAEDSKPTLYVLTSLPLLFEEGFGIGPAKGQAATFLREHYRLRPIDLPSDLPPGATLLAAQPRALPAEELVALDAWIRAGGKLLLLADPLLEWPSKRSVRDRLRPPLGFADTGLMAHWGLRLDAPDVRGPKVARWGGLDVAYVSPGRLTKVRGGCAVEAEGVLARCRLERGRVLVVADADLLDEESIEREYNREVDNLTSVSAMLGWLGANPAR